MGLVFYEQSTGTGEFYPTNEEGGISPLLSQYTDWRKDWSLIVPGTFSDSDYDDLLFYIPSTETGWFYSIDGQGGISLLSQNTSLPKDLSLIVPGRFSESGYDDLLFYIASTGTVAFYSTDSGGGMAPLSQYTHWRNGVSLIVSGNFSESLYDDLLFYIPSTSAGSGEFYSTDGQGGMPPLSHYTDWRKDWSQILQWSFLGGIMQQEL